MRAGAASPADRAAAVCNMGVKTELALGAVCATHGKHTPCSLRGGMPYAVSVKDRMMYSHTFVFEDNQPFTTGCTSVATVTIEGNTLGPFDILIDICVAQQLLREAVAAYDHKNLDTLAGLQIDARLVGVFSCLLLVSF